MAGLKSDPLDKALGSAVRVRRKQLAMSQSVLAEGLGLTFQQIQKYERGSNRISFSAMVKIARILNCRVADLVGDLDLDEKDSESRMQLNAWLAEAGAVELLESFNKIKSKTLRQAVLDLSRKLSAVE